MLPIFGKRAWFFDELRPFVVYRRNTLRTSSFCKSFKQQLENLRTIERAPVPTRSNKPPCRPPVSEPNEIVRA
jgi:hypothetical protein